MKTAIVGAVMICLCGCNITLPNIKTVTPVVVPVTTTTTIPPQQNVYHADLTLPVCDPNPTKYTTEYMTANANFEECGLEAQEKIIARFVVLCPQRNSYYMISSLAIGHVQRDRTCPDFEQDGYSYHVKGWLATEPHTQEANTIAVGQTPDKYILVEARKVK